MILQPVKPSKGQINLNVLQPISTVLLQMGIIVNPCKIKRIVLTLQINLLVIVIILPMVNVCGQKEEVVLKFNHVLNCKLIQHKLVWKVFAIMILNPKCVKIRPVQWLNSSTVI